MFIKKSYEELAKEYECCKKELELVNEILEEERAIKKNMEDNIEDLMDRIDFLKDEMHRFISNELYTSFDNIKLRKTIENLREQIAEKDELLNKYQDDLHMGKGLELKKCCEVWE